MVAMYIVYCLFTYLKIDPYLSLPIVLVAMILIGYLVFQLTIKRVLHKKHEIQIMATLSMMLILQNLALMIFHADYRSVRTAYTSAVVRLGGITISVPRLVAFLVSIVVCTALYLFLTKTYTGSSMLSSPSPPGSPPAWGIWAAQWPRLPSSPWRPCSAGGAPSSPSAPSRPCWPWRCP